MSRAVVSGGAGGAAPQEFGSSVNPIPTRGTDYAHPITASTPGFQNLTTALMSDMVKYRAAMRSFLKLTALYFTMFDILWILPRSK